MRIVDQYLKEVGSNVINGDYVEQEPGRMRAHELLVFAKTIPTNVRMAIATTIHQVETLTVSSIDTSVPVAFIDPETHQPFCEIDWFHLLDHSHPIPWVFMALVHEHNILKQERT
jgi:hypothetical protein